MRLMARLRRVAKTKEHVSGAHPDIPSRSNHVELGGFEPPTSSMPWKRATNCAIAPKGDRHRLAPGGWWS